MTVVLAKLSGNMVLYSRVLNFATFLKSRKLRNVVLAKLGENKVHVVSKNYYTQKNHGKNHRSFSVYFFDILICEVCSV